MELRRDLQALIGRAWALHDGLVEEIKYGESSFCRIFSEHGRYCNIVETTFQERERLVAIRDSLKEVGDLLLLLQRLQSLQPIDRQEAVAHLEESRLILMGKVNQYHGRSLDAVKELNACFNNEIGKSVSDWNLNANQKSRANSRVQKEKRRVTASFLICCIRMLVKPWKWQQVVGVAAKLVLVSASVSSTVKFCHARMQYCSTQRKLHSFAQSTDARIKETALSLSKSPLDVFCGRG